MFALIFFLLVIAGIPLVLLFNFGADQRATEPDEAFEHE